MTSFAFCVRFVWTRSRSQRSQRSKRSVPPICANLSINTLKRISHFATTASPTSRDSRAFNLAALALLLVSLISFIDAISEMSFSLTGINFSRGRRKASQNRQPTFLINRILSFSAIDSLRLVALCQSPFGFWMKSFRPDLDKKDLRYGFGSRKSVTANYKSVLA